jgi:hypothetical protein
MNNNEKALQDIYNDPGSLFYTPFTNDALPAGNYRPSKSKPTLKTKAKKPLENSPADRFQKQSDITPFFTGVKDEENTQNRIIPIGTMNSYFYSANMQPKATQEAHGKYIDFLREQYKKDGTSGLPAEIKKQSDVMEIMQKWRLADNTLLFADGASGIFKALTCYDNYFEAFEPLENKSTGEIEKYCVYATLDQLKKCFFGVCVDEYGNLKRGTSEILKKSGILKEFTDAIFMSSDGKSTGKEPVLFMYDKANNFLGYYKPIIFEGWDSKRKAFKMLLDPKFFKLQVDMNTGKLKADVRYIPTIGGLTSLNIIGRAYLARENPGIAIPYAKTATRLVHTLQASLNMQSLLGIELFPNMTEQTKQKIRLNKSGLIELSPTCFDKRYNSVNYKKASEQVGLTSDILYKGLEVTDGLGDLIMTPGSNDIYLPSIDKSCYFDNQYAKAVFINCETPRQAIENTNKISYTELKKLIAQGNI